jgi:hypothetical protein
MFKFKYDLFYSMVIYHLHLNTPRSPESPLAERHAMPVPCNSAANVSTEAWTSDFQKPRPQVELWFVSVGCCDFKKNREGLKPRKRLVHGGKCPTISYPYSTKIHQVEPQLVLVFMPPKKNINFHKFP